MLAHSKAQVQPGLLRLRVYLIRFAAALPALFAALFILRVAELSLAWPPGASLNEAWRNITSALMLDVLSWGRVLPAIFLVAAPVLGVRSPKRRLWCVGAIWTTLVLAQFLLVCYFIGTRVVLGSDLFAYNLAEIRTSVSGVAIPWGMVAALVLALMACWTILRHSTNQIVAPVKWQVLAGVSVLCVVLLLVGPRELPRRLGAQGEYQHSLSVSKLPAFLDDTSAALLRRLSWWFGATHSERIALANPIAGLHYVDARYPLLHQEQTPDVLGPYFSHAPQGHPNFVFLVVEGLGRSFSGQGAELGSFTPFLDELAQRSLYFDNFLSGQGRTFAVLPTLFGSLPYGDQGMAAMGSRMPAHASLLSLMHAQGYRTRFFCGFDPEFDNEAVFLSHQNLDEIHGRNDFPAGVPHLSYWGYDDRELFSVVSQQEAQPLNQPFVDVIQTVSTHDPYHFLGQENYANVFERRLAQLGFTQTQKEKYRAQREIYQSVLYADDALRRYFQAAQTQPWFANTIFVITGDHRLPEIPLSTWIDRYHVPLLIYSPLLKQADHIRAVSSQFDLAPSLLAFLAQSDGLLTPEQVTWVGTGLDMSRHFGNTHQIPLKQTKTQLDGFVSGEWALNRGDLYRLTEGLTVERVDDEAMRLKMVMQFNAFERVNEQVERSGQLLPPEALTHLRAYDPATRATVVSAGQQERTLRISEIKVPLHARAGALTIEATVFNADANRTLTSVLLGVLQTADGKESSESYGEKLVLAPGAESQQHLKINTQGVRPGPYFLSVFPSDPSTGKRNGDGRFHLAVVIDP